MATADAASLYAYRSMPDISRYQSWAPESLENAEEFIAGATAVAFNQPNSWFQLALRDRWSEELIGDLGLHFMDDGGFQVEIGVTVSPMRQNQGIASEAIEATLDYLFFNLKKHRVAASVDPRNQASVRLFQRIGFRKEGHFRQSLFLNGEWVDDVAFGILESEWATIRRSAEPGM